MSASGSPPAGVGASELDFRKYTGIIKAMLGDALSIVVCDLRGKRLWSLSREGRRAYADALAKLNESVPDWTKTSYAIRRCTIDDNVSGYVTSICDLDRVPVGGLMVLLNHRNDPDNTLYKKISDGMHNVARLLGSEVRLLQELDAMTAELSRRYEELNLIYNTEDSVKYFDEGQDAIRNLVRNTCQYLSSGYSALVMADRATVHSYSHPTHPIAEPARLQESLVNGFHEHMAFRKEVVVHNGGRRYRELLDGVECKLLGCPVFDENNDVVGTLFLANDATAPAFTSSDRKLLQVMAHKASRIIQANYDPLTGMMTRNGFEYHLETGLYVVRYKQRPHSVLIINVDRLHVVNDTSGHHAGDGMIKRIAGAIREQLSESDVVARLGGGEFGAMLVDQAEDEAAEVAERIRSAVQRLDFTWENRRFQASVSIGLANMESQSESVLSVMNAAEVACAAAKDLGRDRVQVYQNDNTMLVRRQAQIHWLGKLHSALREDRFTLYCQPIRRAGHDGPAHHAEILIRLEDGEGGTLSPDIFLGSAERYNLMPAIDRWVIRNTLKTLVANLPQRLLSENVWAINLSGQTLSDPNFMQFVLDETRRSGIDPGSLCFEITETAAVANLKEAGKFIDEMRKKGFQFSLDDFGTGLSSFAYLKALPVNYLKIDGAIAREVVADPVSASMVRAITQVGRDMGLESIAEFVESEELEAKLLSLGVHYVQGHTVGRPVALRDRLVKLTSRLAMGDEDDTRTAAALTSVTQGAVQLGAQP